MIHELRQYTLKPGKLAEYLEYARTIGRPARGNDYGVNHGYWTTEHGPLNQVWHLWSYESLKERARLRAELQKNKAWTTEYTPRILPLLERQDIRLIHPMKPIVPPAKEGGVYELRIYRTQVGHARRWAEAYLNIMPVREKYSPNVGLWVGEAPQPNEVLHMWNYPDGAARAATRAALFKDPEWNAFLKSVDGVVVEMQSTLLIPTAYSSMK
jgi:hypothetical protein